MNMKLIKDVVPFLFSIIILSFIAKLGMDNNQLRHLNEALLTETKDLSQKNSDLAKTLHNLTEEVGKINALAQQESKRRAAAEMKSQRLQEEVKSALKDNKCSIELIPSDAVIGVRKAADSARGGKGSGGADTSKPAD